MESDCESLKCKSMFVCSQGSKWWLLRCLFVHQQVLDEFSPTLHKSITALLEELVKCEPLMTKEHNHVCFHLEAAQIHLFYRHVAKSQEHCKVALKASNMNLELTGMLRSVIMKVRQKGRKSV